MTPELASYISKKERMLSRDFKVLLNPEDLLVFNHCTTYSSVDVAARKIIKKHWEEDEYAS